MLEATTTGVPEHIVALHRHCGVYTHPTAVSSLLDRIGWTRNANLCGATLLEPAVGDGVFIVEAARRLIQSLRKRRQRLTIKELAPRISGFEIHEGEAQKARANIVAALRSEGVHTRTAGAVAMIWVRAADFLLAELPQCSFTHVVGNPPYVRWGRIPIELREVYEAERPIESTKGDLGLAFLERGLQLLGDDGRLGFLFPDRWLYAAYAETFRNNTMPSYLIESRRRVRERDVFVRRVDAYPVELVIRRRKRKQNITRAAATILGVHRKVEYRLYETWRRAHPFLEDSGCSVRVGPALGCTSAFVGTQSELTVEPELLARYLPACDLKEQQIDWSGKYLVCMDSEKGPIDIHRYPNLERHLESHRPELTGRSIVKAGAPWYRPIDRVIASVWAEPKILIPEMSKTPRIVVDRSGAIPAHGVYAIFSSEWPIDLLAGLLRAGLLWTTLQAIAPSRKGGHLRAYARFLRLIPLPRWRSVSGILRNRIGSSEITDDQLIAVLDMAI